ncbi:hypothetical protein DEI89_15375 [Curtobacterium sp. MCBD17_030]|nr:hypothetical protein DEI89_15375 [Curtobacterium sp. MCBD17_030]
MSIVAAAVRPENAATSRMRVGLTPGQPGYAAGMADDPMSALFSSATTAVAGGGDARRALGLVGLLGLLTGIVSGVGAVVVAVGVFVVVLGPILLAWSGVLFDGTPGP